MMPDLAQMVRYLRHTNRIAIRAQQFGHHRFGAILVALDQETVLIKQGNVDTVNYAEFTLLRIAAVNFSAAYLCDSHTSRLLVMRRSSHS